MPQPTQHPAAATNEFDAAKTIVETLKGLDKQLQARAMRFASETLGLHGPAPGQGTAAPSQQAENPVAAASPAAPPRSMDIQQFAELKAPRSDTQFAAVVAYFYRFETPEAQRKDVIDAETLNEAARLARRRRPGNAIMTLNNAKNAGYLDPAERGKFKISAVGENLVAMTLPGNGSKTPANRGAGRKKKSKKKSVTKRPSRRGG